MITRYRIATWAISLILLLAITIPSAHAITAKTNRTLYIPQDKMFVVGTASENEDVSVSVINPNGRLVSVVNGKADAYGSYNITVLQFPNSNTTTFPYGKYTLKSVGVLLSVTTTFIFAAQRISLLPSKTSYSHNSTVFVTGMAPPDDDVTITVTNPTGLLVGISQGKPNADGKYNITVFRFPSSNNANFPYGSYTIRATASSTGDSITESIMFLNQTVGLLPKHQQVPVSAPRITDSFGNPINTIRVNDFVAIEADVRNNDTVSHTFAYLVQVKDSNLVIDQLGWIRGLSLDSGKATKPGLSWSPSKAGTYTIEVFIWESLTNPLALSPVGRITVTVS